MPRNIDLYLKKSWYKSLKIFMVQVQTSQKNLNVVQTSWQWAFPLESSKSGMDGA